MRSRATPTRSRLKRGVDAFGDLRKNLGRVILLGLEVLIIADIIRTIVVDQSLESVGVLGIIVVIRVVLSFSLEVEIDGMWPWNKWRVASEDNSFRVVRPRRCVLSAGLDVSALEEIVARTRARPRPRA